MLRYIFVPVVLLGCGSSAPSGPPGTTTPADIAEVAGAAQTGVVAMALPIAPSVRVTDTEGRGMSGVTVQFTVQSGDGWVVETAVATDGAGQASTPWYLGPVPQTAQQLVASVSGVGTITFTATATPLEAGETYYGTSQYVEMIAGDLPVIISAPHGGTQTPAGIPDRDDPDAVTVRDANTDALALTIHETFDASTAGTPHTVIMHLHRRKLDANREIGEAAEGNATAERAWREYHSFLDAARADIERRHGRGFYADIHGHGHDIQRLELGYLLSASDLAADDAVLNGITIVNRSSIRALATAGLQTHAELLRGDDSLGTLFELAGYPAVPSSHQPSPGSDPYFTGGYSTRRHGSREGGTIDGVQIEANMQGVRDTEQNRAAFAAALVDVLRGWLTTQYGISID